MAEKHTKNHTHEAHEEHTAVPTHDVPHGPGHTNSPPAPKSSEPPPAHTDVNDPGWSNSPPAAPVETTTEPVRDTTTPGWSNTSTTVKKEHP